MKYNNIIQRVKAENREGLAARIAAIKDNDIALQRNATPTKWSAYFNGDISREKCVDTAIKRSEKEFAKREARDLAALERYANAPEIEAIQININWTRSKVWGYNPHVTARIWYKNVFEIDEYTAKASGCNYDKRSHAVAGALNQCEAITAILCDMKEKAIENGEEIKKTVSGLDINPNSSGYGAIPFIDGCGMSAIQYLLEKCGFKLTKEHGTKTTDYYWFERVNG